MHHFTLLSIQDKTIHFCDHSGTGVVFHAQADQLILTGLIEFFDPKDAKQIVTVSEIPGSLLTRLAGNSLYVPTTRFNYLPFLIVVFAMALMAAFPIRHNLTIGPFQEPGGIFIFPLAYIFTDIINELFGYQTVKRTIYAASITLSLIALLLYISLQFKEAPNPVRLPATFSEVYSEVPKILSICAIGLLLADTLNAYLFKKMKIFLRGKQLWLRSLLSNSISQICFTLTWIGILRFDKLFNSDTYLYTIQNLTFNLIYFIVAIPLIYGIRHYIYHQEEKLLEAEMRAA